jgi:hypothetical protein
MGLGCWGRHHAAPPPTCVSSVAAPSPSPTLDPCAELGTAHKARCSQALSFLSHLLNIIHTETYQPFLTPDIMCMQKMLTNILIGRLPSSNAVITSTHKSIRSSLCSQCGLEQDPAISWAPTVNGASLPHPELLNQNLNAHRMPSQFTGTSKYFLSTFYINGICTLSEHG